MGSRRPVMLRGVGTVLAVRPLCNLLGPARWQEILSIEHLLDIAEKEVVLVIQDHVAAVVLHPAQELDLVVPLQHNGLFLILQLLRSRDNLNALNLFLILEVALPREDTDMVLPLLREFVGDGQRYSVVEAHGLGVQRRHRAVELDPVDLVLDVVLVLLRNSFLVVHF